MAFVNDFVDEEGVADQHHGPQAVGGGVEVVLVAEAIEPGQGHPVGRGAGDGACGGTDWKSRSCSVLLTRVDKLGQTSKFRQELIPLKRESLGKLTRATV